MTQHGDLIPFKIPARKAGWQRIRETGKLGSTLPFHRKKILRDIVNEQGGGTRVASFLP
jgi:hypothetical protein